MNEVKKIIKARKRSTQPLAQKKAAQRLKEDMLKVGSGLVFESNSLAKSPLQRTQPVKIKTKFMKMNNTTDEDTVNDAYLKRKSILEGELDQSSETGSMHMMAAA